MSTDEQPLKGEWALILGASSGFGEAVALELAGLGMNIFGVHLDRKSTLPNAERIIGEIKRLIIAALYGIYFELNPRAANVPIAVAPIVAKKPINKLLRKAKPQGFFVPQTISSYHRKENASGFRANISSEK